MTINAYISTKIRWLSFAAILCVVLGHSFLVFSPVIAIFCQWHVPWFFFCSGILLSVSLSRHSLMELVQKKFLSLFLPYVIWCLIGAVLTFPHRTFKFSWLGVFGLDTVFPCGNPNLWYLHVLIVYTLVALMLGRWLRASRSAAMVGCVIFCVLFVLSIMSGFTVVYGTPSSPFYFIGGVAASHFLLKDRHRPFGVVYASFVLTLILTVACRWMAFTHPGVGVKTCAIVCQIACFWYGYDVLERHFSISTFHPQCLTAIFFVYCFHGPVMLYAKDLWLLVFGDSQASLAVGGWCVWAVMVVLSFSAAAGLRRYVPKAYLFFSGGR